MSKTLRAELESKLLSQEDYFVAIEKSPTDVTCVAAIVSLGIFDIIHKWYKKSLGYDIRNSSLVIDITADVIDRPEPDKPIISKALMFTQQLQPKIIDDVLNVKKITNDKKSYTSLTEDCFETFQEESKRGVIDIHTLLTLIQEEL